MNKLKCFMSSFTVLNIKDLFTDSLPALQLDSLPDLQPESKTIDVKRDLTKFNEWSQKPLLVVNENGIGTLVINSKVDLDLKNEASLWVCQKYKTFLKSVPVNNTSKTSLKICKSSFFKFADKFKSDYEQLMVILIQLLSVKKINFYPKKKKNSKIHPKLIQKRVFFKLGPRHDGISNYRYPRTK